MNWTNVNASLFFTHMQHIFHLIKILWIKIFFCLYSLSPTGTFSGFSVCQTLDSSMEHLYIVLVL
jgi:hypothetical protein